MRSASRFFVTMFLVAMLLSNALPCGPGYVSPLFDTTSAPENPYTDFAAGRLGIVKPSFHRSVLYAAYRHIAGNGMNTPEQQAIVSIWKAEIDNKDFPDDTVDEAVKLWVDQRKKVEMKEEKPPEIYTARAYGGYDFFPNCTKNAFETAAETLSDRLTSHGPSDASVVNWVTAQDQVFENCASGKRTPDEANPGSPLWLQKDRAYQRAAAEFYSLDFESAKKHFAEIAQDTESPWAETADYLVARTLIRQASLSKDAAKSGAFYDEADARLAKFVSRSGKFTASAERLAGLIAYRRRPKERVSELAKKLAFPANENFRQDLIDYTWLLDKFETEVLANEEKRKEAERIKNAPTVSSAANAANADMEAAPRDYSAKKDESDLDLAVWDDNRSISFFVRVDADDETALAAAEKTLGKPLTKEQKEQVRNLRQTAYAGRFTDQKSGYDGGYYGEETLTPSLLPAFLKQDDLTDWLYTYQMPGSAAYLYSFERFKATASDLWLMTALSKADKSSSELPRLLEAADRASRSAPGYTTIAYHTARILIETGKNAEARKLIDEMLAQGDRLPISAQNSFMTLRLKLAATLEDFLKDSLQRPYAFDYSGDVSTVDEIIAEQKTYYDPEYNKEGREAFEREVEERFTTEKLWQDRLMFDSAIIEVFNQHFPTQQLIEVAKSPALPEYQRERFIIAIWTRAFLLDDLATVLRMTPELIKYHPEMATQLEPLMTAKTLPAQDRALLYFILKNPLFSPYIEDGMGKTDNEQEQFDSNDWWCEPYDEEYSDEANASIPRKLPPRPAFLTAAQSKLAQSERKRLRDAGDAPKFLAAKVLDWAKKAPADRRVPEALYIMIEANGWTKYGCGNNEDLRNELVALLKKRYPTSEWAAKLVEQEKDQ